MEFFDKTLESFVIEVEKKDSDVKLPVGHRTSGFIYIETLRFIFFMRGKSWQFLRKNGSRYQKTFCGRLISEKFHVLKTPCNSLPVDPKPEVVEILTPKQQGIAHIKADDSLILLMCHMTHFD